MNLSSIIHEMGAATTTTSQILRQSKERVNVETFLNRWFSTLATLQNLLLFAS